MYVAFELLGKVEQLIAHFQVTLTIVVLRAWTICTELESLKIDALFKICRNAHHFIVLCLFLHFPVQIYEDN